MNSTRPKPGCARPVDALRPDFEAIGKTLPAAIHGNFGFTSHGSKKTGITGQYYDGGASTDDNPETDHPLQYR